MIFIQCYNKISLNVVEMSFTVIWILNAILQSFKLFYKISKSFLVQKSFRKRTFTLPSKIYRISHKGFIWLVLSLSLSLLLSFCRFCLCLLSLSFSLSLSFLLSIFFNFNTKLKIQCSEKLFKNLENYCLFNSHSTSFEFSTSLNQNQWNF